MANKDNDNPTLFNVEEQVPIVNQPEAGPVTCLGLTFENDEARREYFREELRKKLPELRNIEGFPIGDDDDIINLSDPPYYTACPNPWLNDFIAQWEEEKKELVKQGKREEEKVVTEPYASDVSEGRSNPIYLAHSYHTKCPHSAIMKYIMHYTQPGDIVYDGFCGSGMTGIAATMCSDPNSIYSKSIVEEWERSGKQNPKFGKRNAICGDISPIASFIAYNYNTPINPQEFEKKALAIINEVETQLEWMYETKHSDGRTGKINYVVWSDVFRCPHCENEIVFFDSAVDLEQKSMKESFKCNHCGSLLNKKQLDRVYETVYDKYLDETISQIKTTPVLIKYQTPDNKRHIKKPDANDIAVIEKINNMDFPYWFPTSRTIDGAETRRNDVLGITHVHHFYTKRNLYVAATIYNKTHGNGVYDVLMTSYLNGRGSKMTRYKLEKAGNASLSGTMYIGSTTAEQNLFDAYKGKIDDFVKVYSKDNCNVVNIASATASSITSNSIDYIFTDPPFGENIMYSELNSLIEAWLRVRTNSLEEAIIDRKQNKDILVYQELMHKSLQDYYRILKPGRWLTMEFSNTSAAVWNVIQNALQGVGFVVVSVAGLDKKQGSFMSIMTKTAVKQDLVITCYKPSDELTNKMKDYSISADNVWDFINEYLLHLPVHIERNKVTTAVIERSPKILFDRLISYYVVKGYPVPIDATAFQQGLRERYIEIDGMFFTAVQAAEYEEKKKSAPEFVPMGIIVSDEANGIQWLKNQLRDAPKTYQEIQPEWMQAINGLRKGDILPELATLLEENFIEMEGGKWRLPNIQDDVDKEALRTKTLLREFKLYVETAQKPKAKIKEARVEALRAGFKQCYIDKDFQTIVTVGDKIPQNLRDEDEVLLQFYDIAMNKI